MVDDIVMAPTSASDAAKLLVNILQVRAPFGPHHLGKCR